MQRTAARSSLQVTGWAVLALATGAMAQTCGTGAGGNFVVTTAVTIDTDTGDITPPGGVSPAFDGTSFNFVDIDVQAGGILTGVGSQPLVLLATGNVSIDGLIDVSGSAALDIVGACNLPGTAGGAGGPGGFAGGAAGGLPPGNDLVDGDPGLGPGGGAGGQDTSFSNGTGGCGGGGGHATAGTPGDARGAGGIGGTGGVTYPSLPPLTGGSGGGGASCDDDTSPVGPPVTTSDDGGAGGGGGGGAIRIVAGGLLEVDGTIDASGGDGGSGDTCNFSGAGGGGAGGAIELLATVLPVVTGTLNVSGGVGGGHSTGPERGGDGGDGRTSTGIASCVPLPTCTVMAPGGVSSGDISLSVDSASPSAGTVTVSFEFSTDAGGSWIGCTAAATSPLPNPAPGIPTGPASFTWDSRVDGVGLAAPQVGVLVRALVDDGVAPVPGTCTTAPFDVDNTALCPGICGDCNSSGTGPDILDALVAAQLAAGLMAPVPPQDFCCDVDSTGSLTILDALQMAQVAAGLSVVIGCP